MTKLPISGRKCSPMLCFQMAAYGLNVVHAWNLWLQYYAHEFFIIKPSAALDKTSKYIKCKMRLQISVTRTLLCFPVPGLSWMFLWCRFLGYCRNCWASISRLGDPVDVVEGNQRKNETAEKKQKSHKSCLDNIWLYLPSCCTHSVNRGRYSHGYHQTNNNYKTQHMEAHELITDAFTWLILLPSGKSLT